MEWSGTTVLGLCCCGRDEPVLEHQKCPTRFLGLTAGDKHCPLFR